jgi:hypothetical protein
MVILAAAEYPRNLSVAANLHYTCARIARAPPHWGPDICFCIQVPTRWHQHWFGIGFADFVHMLSLHKKNHSIPFSSNYLQSSMTAFGHNENRLAQEDINMAETTKSITNITDDIDKSGQSLNAAKENDAVGYKEYIEARDLDISEKEVSTFLSKWFLPRVEPKLTRSNDFR